MRFITATATAAAIGAGALLIGIPAATAATPTSAGTPAPGSVCATSSSFAQVQTGQTVAQVEQEMGSVGDPTDGVVQDHSPGFTAFEEQWKQCGTLGLITFGVEYKAAPGQPLTVFGKSELPTTRLGG